MGRKAAFWLKMMYFCMKKVTYESQVFFKISESGEEKIIYHKLSKHKNNSQSRLALMSFFIVCHRRAH